MGAAGDDRLAIGEALKPYEHLLAEEGLITKDQLAIARISKENLGVDLGSVLLKRGFTTETKLLEFFSKHTQVPFISIKSFDLDPELVRQLPYHVAKQHRLILIAKKDEKYCVAMANPFDSFAKDDLKDSLQGIEYIPYLASAKEITETLDKYFQGKQSQDDGSNITLQVANDNEIGNVEDAKKAQEAASGQKVVNAVNSIIGRAHAEHASDIHIEPSRRSIRVRYRIDGLLRERGEFPKTMLLPLVSRIKILASLDIAEHRIPQDGRVRVLLVGKALDLRISTCPTQFGEKIVIRLHTPDDVKSIESLGFLEKERKLFSEIISKSHGIFLVTGPTGSGKSTTLYAALSRINSPERNVISIEDPIESEIEGVNQVAVNIKTGVTFAAVLRSALRQDPDIIMLGEIRDAETAQIAVRAAITGHMVLSTLHTNSAAGAIPRLEDLGVEPFMLSSALKGVLAQRLVRKICDLCRIETPLDPEKYGPDIMASVKKAHMGKGCKNCNFTGYRGRIGIFELAAVDEKMRHMINSNASEIELTKYLRENGTLSIIDDGLAKVNMGLTTLDEVLRVTTED